MKRTLHILSALVLIATASAAARANAPQPGAAESEEAAVRQAVQYYIDGQASGDGEIVARAFHPEAHLTHMRDGAVRTIPIDTYLGYFRGEPASDEGDRQRWIESVDIAGDAAVAKVVLDYPRIRYTDYMSLLKVDGEWKIIHKNFTATPQG
jgi:hypothetical protein